MKVVSVGILSWLPDAGRPDPLILDNAHELSEFGYFQRGGCVVRLPGRPRMDGSSLAAAPRARPLRPRRSVKEMLVFISRTIVKRTPPGGRQSIKHEGALTWQFSGKARRR